MDDEPVDKWVTELKRLSQSCEFGILRDDLIKDGNRAGGAGQHCEGKTPTREGTHTY